MTQVVIATKFGSDLGGAIGPDWGARGGRRYLMRAVEASPAPAEHRLDRPLPAALAGPRHPDRGDPGGPGRPGPLPGKSAISATPTWPAWQAADADWIARTRGLTRFISAQNQYNLLHREVEAELLPACQRFGLGLLPYFPLASGLLTGKYQRGQSAPAGSRLSHERFARRLAEAPWDTIEALDAFARERSLTMVDVAIGWLAAQPAVASVIAGATRPEQVRANVAAGQWQPTPEDLATLDELTQPPR